MDAERGKVDRDNLVRYLNQVAETGWLRHLETPGHVLAFVDDILAALLAAETRIEELRGAITHVVNHSPGTPMIVKQYLIRALEGSWGEPYERALTPPATTKPEQEEKA